MRHTAPLLVAALGALSLFPAPANAASPVVLNRYVLTLITGTDPVDHTALTDLCADEDGCEVITWAVLESTGSPKRTRLIVDGAGNWQTTDGLKGVDGSGGTETALANVGPWCSLMDGDAAGDSAAGFFFRNFLGADCHLVLID